MASFTLIISTSDDFFSILSIEYKYYGATVIIPSKNSESGLPWGRYEQKLRLKKAPWFRKTPNFYSIILNISSPESQTTLSVILSVSTPPIKYKNVYRNFQNYPHSLPYWIKKRARAVTNFFLFNILKIEWG